MTRIWPHLLKISLMENIIFCAVSSVLDSGCFRKNLLKNSLQPIIERVTIFPKDIHEKTQLIQDFRLTRRNSEIPLNELKIISNLSLIDKRYYL